VGSIEQPKTGRLARRPRIKNAPREWSYDESLFN